MGLQRAGHSWVADTHIFIIICLTVAIFGFILYGILSASSTQISVSFLDSGKFSAIIFFKCIFDPLFCFFSFWDSYYVYWDLSHKLHMLLSFFFFTYFSICCSGYVIFLITCHADLLFLCIMQFTIYLL